MSWICPIWGQSDLILAQILHPCSCSLPAFNALRSVNRPCIKDTTGIHSQSPLHRNSLRENPQPPPPPTTTHPQTHTLLEMTPSQLSAAALSYFLSSLHIKARFMLFCDVFVPLSNGYFLFCFRTSGSTSSARETIDVSDLARVNSSPLPVISEPRTSGLLTSSGLRTNSKVTLFESS